MENQKNTFHTYSRFRREAWIMVAMKDHLIVMIVIIGVTAKLLVEGHIAKAAPAAAARVADLLSHDCAVKPDINIAFCW